MRKTVVKTKLLAPTILSYDAIFIKFSQIGLRDFTICLETVFCYRYCTI